MVKFLNREQELKTLGQVATGGGLAVVTGRRRIGKTRLLVEWTRAHGGVYFVADESAAPVQRRRIASAIAERYPGFADVEYPDWGALFERLGREAVGAGDRGPFVFDELPYLAQGAPEIASVLQRFVDHTAEPHGIAIAVAGSSQRMMRGLVLDSSAPLFGRSRAHLALGPLPITFLERALDAKTVVTQVQHWTAWGGVPRYWELAQSHGGSAEQAVADLVLSPLGALHHEPERLLLEEGPPAAELRPVLDAIGGGAHRVSEIAGRLGRPATSLSRPLARLTELGLVMREVPAGRATRKSKLSLYKIADPFHALWFRVVAPHRAQLTAGTSRARAAILGRHWPGLCAAAWEDLVRQRVPHISGRTAMGRRGPWGPAARWWQGSAAEWDAVANSEDGSRALVGEAKWSPVPFTKAKLQRICGAIAHRALPSEPALQDRSVDRVLFIPARAPGASVIDGVHIVTGAQLW